MSITPMDIVWRDYVAQQHLRQIVCHTSAVFRTNGETVIRQGWLYVGLDALVYIADEPIFGNTNEDRIMYATYESIGWSVRVKKHSVSRTATVWFGLGSSMIGGIQQIDTLHQIASGSAPAAARRPESAERVYDRKALTVSGRPTPKKRNRYRGF